MLAEDLICSMVKIGYSLEEEAGKIRARYVAKGHPPFEKCDFLFSELKRLKEPVLTLLRCRDPDVLEPILCRIMIDARETLSRELHEKQYRSTPETLEWERQIEQAQKEISANRPSLFKYISSVLEWVNSSIACNLEQGDTQAQAALMKWR